MLNKLSLISVVHCLFVIPTPGFADYVRHFGGHVHYGRGHFAGVQHFVGVGNTSRTRRALYYVPDKAPPNTGSKSYAPILGHAQIFAPAKTCPLLMLATGPLRGGDAPGRSQPCTAAYIDLAVAALLRRDNQDTNGATIKVRMGRRGGVEGGRSPTVFGLRGFGLRPLSETNNLSDRSCAAPPK